MKPILFSTEIVRAILDGRKTMTRRIAKGTALDLLNDFTPAFVADRENGLCPYGYPGDIIWVREMFGYLPIPDFDNPKLYFAADANSELNSIKVRWRPSIHMPREAARLFLRVKAVRVERVQEITEADARAEGCVNMSRNDSRGCMLSARGDFKILWNKLNAKRGYGWDTNPFVWVIEFEQVSAEEAQEAHHE